MTIAQFKDLFAHSPQHLFFNNAGIAQIPKPTRDALIDSAEKHYQEGAGCIPDFLAGLEKTRESLAGFLGATPSQTVLFSSTAAAISQVALGFPFSAGDEILTWDQEYPSSFYPWKVAAERTGARLVVAKSGSRLETSAEQLLSHVTNKTKAIAFSWVQYRTGSITDLATVTSFAQSKGIFTCADIIQGAGAIPFDFQKSGLDAACGGSHKFLCSPAGIGFLLLREKHIGRLQPTSVGAFTFGTPEDLSDIRTPMRHDIYRFEPGAKNFAELSAFGATLRLFQQVGIEPIHREILRLTDQLMNGLEAKGYVLYSQRSQIPRSPQVTFGPSDKSALKTIDEIKARLTESGATFGVRPPGIRLSPHAFTRDEEVQRLLTSL